MPARPSDRRSRARRLVVVGARAAGLGTSTGAQLVGGQLCLERFGQPNVSWYAPIVPAVAFYGVPVLVG